MKSVTPIKTADTKTYRKELSIFIAHHQGLAMINLELAKQYWWHPKKRKEYLFLAESCRKAATDLLNEYRAIWGKGVEDIFIPTSI